MSLRPGVNGGSPATTEVVPRLLRRQEAARYLGISVAQLDVLRAMGEIHPLAVPSRLGGSIRKPLFDRQDLDGVIDRWKVNRESR